MKTLKCGLLGRKLGHSYSPLIHGLFQPFLRDYSVSYSYELVEREPQQLGSLFNDGDFDALNITIPYKKAVMPFCSRLDETAAKTGSVNTIVCQDGHIIGYNTDLHGFTDALIADNAQIKGSKVCILGDGGSAASVRCALYDMGAREVLTLSRRNESRDYAVAGYDDTDKYSDCDVLINCTPIGMYPNNGVSAITISRFTKLQYAYDLIYNPAKTALLFDCADNNIKCANGLGMLVRQAARSARLFTDVILPNIAVEDVLKRVEAESRNIILIGMPGCGKSVTGSILADRLGRPFIDTDEIVTEMAGLTPEQFILSRGENKFREYEHEAVISAGKLSGHIISTGGGVCTREENFRPLKQNGVIIFIDVPIERLDSSHRPLSGDFKARQKLYERRLPSYKRFADYTIEAKNIAGTDMVSAIMDIINN